MVLEMALPKIGIKTLCGYLLFPVVLSVLIAAVSFDPEPLSIGESRLGYQARYSYYESVMFAAKEEYIFFLSNINNAPSQIPSVIPMESEWEDPGLAQLTSLIYFMSKSGFGVILETEFLYQVVNYAFYAIAIFIGFSSTFISHVYFRHQVILFSVLVFGFLSPVFPIVQEQVTNLLGADYSLFNASIMARWPKILIVILIFILSFRFFLSGEYQPNRQSLLRSQLLLLGGFFGVISNFRGDAFHQAWILILLIAGFAFWEIMSSKDGANETKKTTRELLGACIVALVLLILGAQLSEFGFFVRDLAYGIESSESTAGHPTWHVLLIGMGFIENQYGLSWNDMSGFEFSKTYFPNEPTTTYGTAAYEELCKRIFFDLLLNDPRLFVDNCIAKFIFLLKSNKQLFAASVLLAAILVFFDRRYIKVVAIWVAMASVCLIVPVVTYPYFTFYRDLLVLLYLVIAFSILELSAMSIARLLALRSAWKATHHARQ